jgi:predicted aconitase with swiveling domain
MRLNDEEAAMRNGAAGPDCQWAIEHQLFKLDQAKGGVATAWMLDEMQSRGVVPAALVLNIFNPIVAQGRALADFTMMSGFAVDITTAIPDRALTDDPEADPPCIRVIPK